MKILTVYASMHQKAYTVFWVLNQLGYVGDTTNLPETVEDEIY